MSISEYKARELIEDRIKFKLYSAEEHYNRLVSYQKVEGNEFLKTFVSRVKFQDELECLLTQLIGARDALIFRIKDKLNLQLKDKDVNLLNVVKKLYKTKNQRLLCELSSVSQDGFWLDHIIELRNSGIHRKNIPIRKSITIYENLGSKTTTSSPWRITFTFEDGQSLELIPYLKESIEKMKLLIGSIMVKEPGLQIEQT
ncbi:MAG TPA: hypothetical protein VF884_06655 [Nitrososphaeraceae archaeon]